VRVLPQKTRLVEFSETYTVFEASLIGTTRTNVTETLAFINNIISNNSKVFVDNKGIK